MTRNVKDAMHKQPATAIEPAVDAVVVREETALARAGRAADETASRSLFAEYLQRIASHTRRRQAADLALFTNYLADAGVLAPQDVPDQARALLDPAAGVWRGMLDAGAWHGITWGLVSGFVRWQLREGYAVGSINVRLSTIKRYVQLAHAAGAISADEHLKIRSVQGYARRQAKRVDAQREQNRIGSKKAAAVAITEAQADVLKEQPDTPQGRRDALLLCLLLDHGLRVSEVAGLVVEAIDLRRGLLVFYRPKVDVTQTHRLTPDSFAAARAYLDGDRPGAEPASPLLLGSRRGGKLGGTMSARAIAERVAKVAAALGIAGLSPHDLRHHWASTAAEHGTHPFALQEAGGWNSLEMPRRYVKRAQIANRDVKLR